MVDYVVHRAVEPPALAGQWDGRIWRDVPTITIDIFYTPRKASTHRPRTLAKMLYDDRGLYVHFRVEDQWVRCVQNRNQDHMCFDSCVEFFTTPVAGGGYFNFEVNAGGWILLYHIDDNGARTPVSDDWLSKIEVFHSMPETIDPEVAEPVVWHIEYFVPFALFEAYTGAEALPGKEPWHANMYKCADKTSHPHWASWKPIGEQLTFHCPHKFVPIAFEGLTRVNGHSK